MATSSERRIDRRVERSQALVLAALRRLLASCGPNKITISAVSREAGVDRKTVYAHFGSIEGLFEKLAEEVVARILDEVERSCGHVTSLTDNLDASTRAFFSAINRAIRSDVELDRHIMANVSEEALAEMLRGILGRALRKRGLVPESVSDELFDFYLQFCVTGTLSVYRLWLLSNRSVPIERASEAARRLLVEGLSGLA